MVTRKQIEALAKFDSKGLPVVSFYLNVDGAHYSPHQNIVRARHLICRQLVEMAEQDWSDRARNSIRVDLDYIGQFIETEFERKQERGLAIFGCSALHISEIHMLASPLDDSITVDTHPVIRPLAALLYDYPSYALALVDREKARIFRVDGDYICELPPVTDKVHARFHAGETEKHIERHIDNQLHAHLQHVVCRLTELAENEHPDLLIVRAAAGIIPELLPMLPNELSNKTLTCAHHLLFDLPEQEILKQAQETVTHHNSLADARIIRELHDTAESGGAAALGTASSLKALLNNAVRTLVIQRNHKIINDRTEEAIRLAFQHGAEVKFVTGSTDWTLCGGIGALLRY